MVGLEDQGRPQPDGGLSTAPAVNPPGPQPRQDPVSPGSTVAVDGAERSPASGGAEVLGVAALQVQQTSQEDVASLQGVLQ